MRFGWIMVGLTYLLAVPAQAQTAEPATPKKIQPVLDRNPLPSPRATGMGGALGASADDLDAASYNPAGIGGVGLKTDKNSPLVRKVYFPAGAAEANAEGVNLRTDIRDHGIAPAQMIGSAVGHASGAKPEYARVNAATGLVLGRTMVVPFSDTQIATTPHDVGSGQTDVRYRNLSGVGYGLSLQDPTGHIALGYFGYSASRTEVNTTLADSDVLDPAKRQATVGAETHKYSGNANNLGAIWRFNNLVAPTIGVTVRDAGNTNYRGNGEDLKVNQQVNSTLAIAPQLGRYGQFSLALETDDLADPTVAWRRKYHVGSELLLGKGTGSYAFFGLRAGYNEAGPSGGVSLHLGLLNFDASTYYVDLAPGTGHVAERRESLVGYVNVAEF